MKSSSTLVIVAGNCRGELTRQNFRRSTAHNFSVQEHSREFKSEERNLNLFTMETSSWLLSQMRARDKRYTGGVAHQTRRHPKAADFSSDLHLRHRSSLSLYPIFAASSSAKMAPKRVVVSNSSSRPQKGFLGTIYAEATSPENTTIVRSILVFGVRCHCMFPSQTILKLISP